MGPLMGEGIGEGFMGDGSHDALVGRLISSGSYRRSLKLLRDHRDGRRMKPANESILGPCEEFWKEGRAEDSSGISFPILVGFHSGFLGTLLYCYE